MAIADRTVAALTVLVGLAALAPWEVTVVRVSGYFDLLFRIASRRKRREVGRRRRQSADADLAGKEDARGPAGDQTTGPAFAGRSAMVSQATEISDWAGLPARLKWKRRVGSRSSSVCLVEDWLYTQEQRPAGEKVSCYSMKDKSLVWSTSKTPSTMTRWAAPARDSTPTFHKGRIDATPARGRLLCLNAVTGSVAWRADLVSDYGVTLPNFGISSSPLVVGDTVFISHAGSKTGPRLLALEAETGKKLWAEGPGADGYCSPQLADLPWGQAGAGLQRHGPVRARSRDGQRTSALRTGTHPDQPDRRAADGDRRSRDYGRRPSRKRHAYVKVGANGDAWSTEQVWETLRPSPAFNDMVQLKGAIYGLNSGRLFKVDPNTGDTVWSAGDFGAGQVLLVGEKLIIQMENGRWPWRTCRREIDRPLTSSGPGREDLEPSGGRRRRLVVRNDKWMACYELK